MTNPIRRAWTWAFHQPFLLIVVTMTLWSANFVVGRGVRADVPPVTLATIRWAGAFALLLPFAWPYLKRDLPVIRQHWKVMLLLSVLGISCFNTFAYTGLHYTAAVNGLLYQSSAPIMIALAAFAIYHERPTLSQAAGVAVSLIGVMIVIVRGNIELLRTFTFNQGDLWILAGFATWGIYTAVLREKPKIHWLSFLAATFLIGVIALAPFWAYEMMSGRVIRPTWAALGASVYVVVFPSAVAYMCYNRAVELSGANRMAPFFHLIPVLGSALAVAFLGERLALYHVLGFTFVMSGIALASRRAASMDPRR